MEEKERESPLPTRLVMLALQGLITIFPIVLTIWIFYWVVSSLEKVFRAALEWVNPTVQYFPGLGIIVGVCVLLGVGWLVNAYLIRTIVRFWDRTLEKIPLIKTVYIALRDLVGFMSMTKKHAGAAALVKMGDKRLIGFITDERAGETLGTGEKDLVAVYMPLGYMIGGYTVYVERENLEILTIGAEAAMRLALTGGMTSEKRGDK
ncbi:MAG: DUF502 domain-containing protein [Helicobacteraceae bacterium]|nr:DUF502 domain-containing protein [Helicobacteraceae bacterium]